MKPCKYLLIPVLAGWTLATAAVPPIVEPQSNDREPPSSRSTLRCWQDGKLILEQRGVGYPSANVPGQVIRFEGARPGLVSLMLIDLHRSTCVLELD